MAKRVLLCIMDGWGISKGSENMMQPNFLTLFMLMN